MVFDFKNIGKLILVSLLLFLTGCFSNRKNVTVEISGRFWNDTVYVDIAGVTDKMYREYKAHSKEKYWVIDSELRNNLHSKGFVFDFNYPTKQKLSKDDTIWKYWKSDDYLIVLAEMPEAYKGVPWKIIVPLENYSWFNYWDSKDIFIYISDKGVIRLDKDIVYGRRRRILQKDMEKITID